MLSDLLHITDSDTLTDSEVKQLFTDSLPTNLSHGVTITTIHNLSDQTTTTPINPSNTYILHLQDCFSSDYKIKLEYKQDKDRIQILSLIPDADLTTTKLTPTERNEKKVTNPEEMISYISRKITSQ